MRTSQAALQSTKGQRCLRILASFYGAPVANAVVHAVDGAANLQVFCREKSGNGCPVSLCLCSWLGRRPCGHAGRVIHGTSGMRSNTAGPPSHTVSDLNVAYGGLTKRLVGWPTS